MKRIILPILSLSIALVSNAQANYTDINPDQVLNATYTGESYALDMDGDATTDLVIFGVKKDTTFSSVAVTITGVAITTMGNTEVIGRSQLMGAETVLVADTLSTGAVIDGSLNYVNSNTPSIFPGVGLGAKDNFGAASIGQFRGQGMKYFGVKFEISGAVHYGWVRMSVSSDAAVGTIDSYGYEATAGTQSVAGQMGSVFASVQENFDDLKVYTFNGDLYISDSEKGSVEIYNLIGNKVQSFVNNGTSTVSMNEMPEGIYLVNYTKGMVTRTFKVVK
jgi:hypothetical protein